MARADTPLVFSDLSACWCDDRGAGATVRVRAMRVLLAHDDPGASGGPEGSAEPQSFYGCILGTHYDGWGEKFRR